MESKTLGGAAPETSCNGVDTRVVTSFPGLHARETEEQTVQPVSMACLRVFKAGAEARWLTSCRREPVEESELHVTQQR